MIRALRKKFILINMLLVLIVLAVVFVSLGVTSYRQVAGDNQRALAMLAEERDGRKPGGSFQVGKPLPEHLGRPPVFVIIRRGDGQASLLWGEDIVLTAQQADSIVDAALAGDQEGILREYSLRYALRREGDAVMVTCIDRQNEIAAARRAVFTFFLAIAAAMTAFFLISLYLSRWALRPVERAWEQQKRFVADASHELKTPLTVILANMGILQENRDQTVESQRKWVENTRAEAERMKQLVDGLLFLAKTDESRAPMIFSALNLTDLVSGAALAFESLAFEKGVQIEMEDIAPQVLLQGDEGQLKQLVAILLENAVKYSVPGGRVTVGLHVRQGKAVLTVHNLGQALSREQMEHVFDRFYRADQSRSEGGYGLGLAIAAGITGAHRGKIGVESSEETGTTFRVSLPV